MTYTEKYKETLNAEEVSKAIRIDSINEGLVRFQHSAPVMVETDNLFSSLQITKLDKEE